MALKRSGVRASSAPYGTIRRSAQCAAPFCFYNPLTAPNLRQKMLCRFLLPTLCCLSLCLSACTAVCNAQSSSSPVTPAQSQPAQSQQGGDSTSSSREDAVIFVNSQAEGTAAIAIAYSGKVSHDMARADVQRLLAAGKWQIVGNPRIEDARPTSGKASDFPVTTGVAFTVSHAPQVVDSAPVLQPYLTAFQRLNHFEVNFLVGELRPYRGITLSETDALRVRLKKDEGIYGYDVVIRDHKGDLGPLSDTPDLALNSPDTKVASQAKAQRPNYLVGIALALAAGLLLGGGVYALLARQSR